MHKVKIIGRGILWTIICFVFWINIFNSMYLRSHDNLAMESSKLDSAIEGIVMLAIPIIWIIAPILFWVYLNRKRRRGEDSKR